VICGAGVAVNVNVDKLPATLRNEGMKRTDVPAAMSTAVEQTAVYSDPAAAGVAQAMVD